MATMKAVQISRKDGPFEVVERDLPEPAADEVRIRVHACGVCHSDLFAQKGLFPGMNYPLIPGHEVAGVIDVIGDNVQVWKPGQHVGVGWFGGNCGVCDQCRCGDFITCKNMQVTGITRDGGYAQYMLAHHSALAAIPPNLAMEFAAPLMCAGVTTFNSLRNCNARPGDMVAIDGVGGLGHMAIQFAAKMGFKVIAISHSPDKRDLARQLGAWGFIDSSIANPAAELILDGGAKVILATAPHSETISKLVDGLAVNGTLLIVAAAAEAVKVSPISLIRARRSVMGWPSGGASDSEATLQFAVLTGVRPMIETFALEEADRAFEAMMANKVRFRAVLKID